MTLALGFSIVRIEGLARDRVLTVLNHETPDRPVLDLGGPASGINQAEVPPANLMAMFDAGRAWRPA
ncbi:MAG: hypothetical protein HY712_07020 [candidate division NC10 bacterium]|nr:hypothetical protein [candidate division NC10 bacterium]